MSPARSREDFPLPEGPTSARNLPPTRCPIASATTCSRPKKNPASTVSNRASPLYGHTSVGRTGLRRWPADRVRARGRGRGSPPGVVEARGPARSRAHRPAPRGRARRLGVPRPDARLGTARPSTDPTAARAAAPLGPSPRARGRAGPDPHRRASSRRGPRWPFVEARRADRLRSRRIPCTGSPGRRGLATDRAPLRAPDRPLQGARYRGVDVLRPRAARSWTASIS